MMRNSLLAAIASLPLACAQNADVATVIARPISRTIEIPGEIYPFLEVSIHAKVTGYVDRVLVDRGSIVKKGELLIELTAPEMQAQIAEAESKVQAADADRLQAVAQTAAAQATSDRLEKASETPGAIAPNELIQAQKAVEAAEALVRSREKASAAAKAYARAQEDLQAYLRIRAPFDGTVTDRLVHPGALVGPGSDVALLVIQQVSHLRLVVPVPEEDIGAFARGAAVAFQVPAYQERVYTGTIARVAHALDRKTRTMPVELDVYNRDGSLSPGMYPAVKWTVHRTKPALFVPKTSVVSTTERTFVIRDRNGRAEWVNVAKGVVEGDLVEVLGDLQPGDQVVRRGTDEIHPGANLQRAAK